MADSLVKLVEYLKSEDAYLLKGALEVNGISAFLEEEHVAGTMTDITPGIRSVKLLVKASDLAAATALVTRLRSESQWAPDAAAWICSECGTDVGGGFEVCWKCGRERDSATVLPDC